MEKVYLSGRMSGLPERVWRQRFQLAKMRAKDMGFEVVNPADVFWARHSCVYRAIAAIVGGETAYRCVLAYDLLMMRRCSHIMMVGGDWRLSRGARLEVMKAKKWGIGEVVL